VSFLVELLLEFVLQLVFEAFVEAGAHAFKRGRSPVHPAAATVGYVLLGGLLGALSCAIFPQHVFSHPYAAVANLIVTPIAVGLAMGALGAWRTRRGKDLVRLDKFAYGYAFALAFALARFAFGAGS
jgi:VIT1/CCC1 family predicted Fe2+/Mn2+ transporter